MVNVQLKFLNKKKLFKLIKCYNNMYIEWVYRREREGRKKGGKKEGRKLMPDWIKVQMKVGYFWSYGVCGHVRWYILLTKTGDMSKNIKFCWKYLIEIYSVWLPLLKCSFYEIGNCFWNLWSTLLTYYCQKKIVTSFSTDFRLTHKNHIFSETVL